MIIFGTCIHFGLHEIPSFTQQDEWAIEDTSKPLELCSI